MTRPSQTIAIGKSTISEQYGCGAAEDCVFETDYYSEVDQTGTDATSDACPQFGAELALDFHDPVGFRATPGGLGQCVGQVAPHVFARRHPPMTAEAVELHRETLP